MCAWRFPEAINFCFLSAWVFSPGFWLAVIDTAGLSTPTGSSDVTGMLCVRVGWGAWTACSSLSFILLFYPVYSAWAVKLPYSGFCFIDMDVVFSHWCVFPLEIFVSSWCPDGQPLRRSVLSMYICIFVFATDSELGGIFHTALTWFHSTYIGKGLMFTASALASIWERRQLGVRMNKSSQRPSANKDLKFLRFEWMVGM